MSRKNSILGLSESEKAEFLDIFILMSLLNFRLNRVEHEKSFITSGTGYIRKRFHMISPGRIAQSVGYLKARGPGFDTRSGHILSSLLPLIVSYWRKCVHEVLVNRLGGLSLPRKIVVRLTDRPDMTLDVYRGRKTTQQQQQSI